MYDPRSLLKELWEDNQNELHQHNIGQDHEERCDDYRVCSRAAHALGASARAHSLKARNQSQ